MTRILVRHSKTNPGQVDQARTLDRKTCMEPIRKAREVLEPFKGQVKLQGYSPADRAFETWMPLSIGLFDEAPVVELPALYVPTEGELGEKWKTACKDVGTWPCYGDHPQYAALLDEVGEAAGLAIQAAEKAAGITSGVSLWVFHKPFTQCAARYFAWPKDWKEIAAANLSECDIITVVTVNEVSKVDIIHV